MRTGLLAVGAAMAIVGAGVVLAVTMPFTDPATSQTAQTWNNHLRAGDSTKYYVPASPSHTASVHFDWNSTNATSVIWFIAGACGSPPSWCLVGEVKAWTGANTSGNWTGQGPAASEYCILIHDSGAVSVNFTGEFVESVPTPSHHLSMIPFAIVLSGGSILIGIGGLAIYLGLFLPAGTYDSPAMDPDDDSYYEDDESEPPGPDVRAPGDGP